MEAWRRRLNGAFLLILAAAITFMVCVPHVASPAETKERVIRIENIDTDSASSLEGELAAAKVAGATKVVFRIFSAGGNLFAGLKMINLVRNSGLDTVCELEVGASMAAVFFESPACKERVVRHGSVLMFHEAQWQGSGASGSAHERAAMTLKTMDRAMAALIAPRMHMTLEQFMAKIEGSREWWLAGQDIVDAHAADRLVE